MMAKSWQRKISKEADLRKRKISTVFEMKVTEWEKNIYKAYKHDKGLYSGSM